MANYILIFLMNSHYSATQKIKNYLARNETLKSLLDRQEEIDTKIKLILSSNNMELEELFSAIAIPYNEFVPSCFISSKEAEMGPAALCGQLVRTVEKN